MMNMMMHLHVNSCLMDRELQSAGPFEIERILLHFCCMQEHQVWKYVNQQDMQHMPIGRMNPCRNQLHMTHTQSHHPWPVLSPGNTGCKHWLLNNWCTFPKGINRTQLHPILIG